MTKIISVLLSLCIMCVGGGCSKPPSKNLVKDRLEDIPVETGKEDNGNKGAVGNPDPNHLGIQDKTPQDDNHGDNNQGKTLQGGVFWNTNRPFWDNLWHWKIFDYWDWRHWGSVSAIAVIGIGGYFYVNHLVENKRFEGFNELSKNCRLSMLGAGRVDARYKNSYKNHEAVLTVAGYNKENVLKSTDASPSSSSSSPSSSSTSVFQSQYSSPSSSSSSSLSGSLEKFVEQDKKLKEQDEDINIKRNGVTERYNYPSAEIRKEIDRQEVLYAENKSVTERYKKLPAESRKEIDNQLKKGKEERKKVGEELNRKLKEFKEKRKEEREKLKAIADGKGQSSITLFEETDKLHTKCKELAANCNERWAKHIELFERLVTQHEEHTK